jgi:selenocysteine lyase/cysteine desulfurase
MHIDFMAFSAWKWLMGPLGLGVLFISREKLEKVKPIFMGTQSVVNDLEYLPYKKELKPTADRFSVSTAGLIDWVYFLASLTLLRDTGFDTVRARIGELSEYLNQRLRMMGFQIYSDRFPNHPTGITVCEKTGISSALLVNRLKEQKVICAERLGRIRFSPHIYISTHQLDEAARALSQACLSLMYSQTMRG